MAKPICRYDNCQRPVRAKGLCGMHYMRERVAADPAYQERQRRNSPTGRFWARVDKDGPIPANAPTSGPCWLWTGEQAHFGHGRFTVDGQRTKAHRYAYELLVGPIPEGLFVCHHCDNPPCTNPDHLYLGTPAQNSADMARRGRSARGEASAHALLTEWDVRDIREMWANDLCTMSQREIAAGYGVSQTTVWSVLNGRSWGHVQPVGGRP